jgi:hypothetical protein
VLRYCSFIICFFFLVFIVLALLLVVLRYCSFIICFFFLVFIVLALLLVVLRYCSFNIFFFCIYCFSTTASCAAVLQLYYMFLFI